MCLRKEILCTVNIQHDCASSGSDCHSIRNVKEWQERSETTKSRRLVNHASTNAYVLNTFSLHNYQHITATIPPAVHVQMNMPYISDHHTVRLHAAKLNRQKKTSNLNDVDPAHLDDSNQLQVQAEVDNSMPPAFERGATAATGKKRKGKAAAKNLMTTQNVSNAGTESGPSRSTTLAPPSNPTGTSQF